MAGRYVQTSNVKVVFIGPEGVGKTSLVARLVGKQFLENYTQTVGVDLSKQTVKTDNATVNLNIWDASGQDQYWGTSCLALRDAQLVFLCFDIANSKSLERLEESFESLSGNLQNRPAKDCQFVLVATKVDTIQSQDKNSRVRAQTFARCHNMRYVETSAKTGKEVDAIKSILHDRFNRTQELAVFVEETPLTHGSRLPLSTAQPDHEVEDVEKAKNILVAAVKKEIDRLNLSAKWCTRGQRKKAKRIESALTIALEGWSEHIAGYGKHGFEHLKQNFLGYKRIGAKESLEEALNSYRYFSIVNRAAKKRAAAGRAVAEVEYQEYSPPILMKTTKF